MSVRFVHRDEDGAEKALTMVICSLVYLAHGPMEEGEQSCSHLSQIVPSSFILFCSLWIAAYLVILAILTNPFVYQQPRSGHS